MLSLELFLEVVDQTVVKVFSTQVSVAVGRLDFKDALIYRKHRHIKGSASQVKDQNVALLTNLEINSNDNENTLHQILLDFIQSVHACTCILEPSIKYKHILFCAFIMQKYSSSWTHPHDNRFQLLSTNQRNCLYKNVAIHVKTLPHLSRIESDNSWLHDVGKLIITTEKRSLTIAIFDLP